MKKINLAEKFSRIDDHWHPRIVAQLNGQDVRLSKLLGSFDWHAHEEEDEFFLVVKGRLTMEFRDRTVELDEGEMVVVPRGVEHRPSASEECQVLLFEPSSTVNTGAIRTERTRLELDWL